MKKKKGILILVAIVGIVVFILGIFFCNQKAERLQKDVHLSDSEIEQYTALACDLSEVNVGNIAKILIRGKKKKSSFVFGNNHTVTIDYSNTDDDYYINSSNATIEQIDSAIIVFNKLSNLKFGSIYKIEYDTAKKIISIQTDTVVFIVDFDDTDAKTYLMPTKDMKDTIDLWRKGNPICITVFFIIFLWILGHLLFDKN